MKVVLTIGHQFSGFKLVHQALLDVGLKSAKLFRDEEFSSEDLQNKIVKANQEYLGIYEQLNPSKLWQGLSSDLFVANLEQDIWGWADFNTIYLLNYWRDFDPRTRFILVYASPVFSLSRLLKTEDNAVELISRFCEDWFNVNEALLNFYNRNQDRCILVNVEALTVSIADAKLLNIAQSRLDVSLNGSIQLYDVENDNLLDIFSTQLSQEYPHLDALYQELEAVAEIFLGTPRIVDKSLTAACTHYKKIKDELLDQSNKIQELVLEQERLLADQAQEVTNLQTQNQRVTVEAADKIKEKDAEIEVLLLQLHQVQEELETVFFKSEEEKKDKIQLTSKIIKLEVKLTEASNKLVQHKKDKVELTNQCVKLDSELLEFKNKFLNEKVDLNLNDKLTGLEKENDLLQLQLHQVQEELEHYYVQYQKTIEVKPLTELLEYFAVDFRQQVDGSNWWHAEHDGRWAGPSLESNIRLPALKTGLYQLNIEIVDLITPDILKKTQFFLDNKQLNLVNQNWFKQLVGLKRRYPIILTTKIELTDLIDMFELKFKFPKVITPVSKGKGSEDSRYLAIRVRTVELKLVK